VDERLEQVESGACLDLYLDLGSDALIYINTKCDAYPITIILDCHRLSTEGQNSFRITLILSFFCKQLFILSMPCTYTFIRPHIH
jgi:hypothetical protein